MLVESNAAIRQAYLVRHGLEGTFRKSLESIWYPSGSRSGSTMIADLQALLAAGDDALASQGDETAVVTIGDDIRVERFDGATLVIVLQPSNTFSSCQDVIGSCSQVLEQRKFSFPVWLSAYTLSFHVSLCRILNSDRFPCSLLPACTHWCYYICSVGVNERSTRLARDDLKRARVKARFKTGLVSQRLLCVNVSAAILLQSSL